MHLFKLILRYALLQSEQILFVYAVGFSKDLSPAILTCCLCTEHNKVISREQKIVIAFGIWKKKVRLFVILGYGLFLKYQFIISKDTSKVML